MAQDMAKGRRTEIEFMNGLIVEKGRQVGVPTPSHAKLVDIVLRVERGELKPSPANFDWMNCNSATEVTENTERFKGLSQHATLTRWVRLENDIRS